MLPAEFGGEISFLPVYRHRFRINKAFHPVTVGDRIKFYRYEKKLRQTELSNLSGVNIGTLKKYENNYKSYDPDKLSAIAKALDIDASVLMDEYLLFLTDGYGEKVKAFRKSKGMTQKAFAVELGTTAKTIQDWEHEYVKISQKTYIKLFG